MLINGFCVNNQVSLDTIEFITLFFHQLLASANCLLSHMLVSDDDLKQTMDEESSEDSDDRSSDVSDDNDDDEDDEDDKVSRLTTMKVDRLVSPNEDKGQGSSESKAVIPKILWDTKVERAKAALAHIVKVRFKKNLSCGQLCVHDWTKPCINAHHTQL